MNSYADDYAVAKLKATRREAGQKPLVASTTYTHSCGDVMETVAQAFVHLRSCDQPRFLEKKYAADSRAHRPHVVTRLTLPSGNHRST